MRNYWLSLLLFNIFRNQSDNKVIKPHTTILTVFSQWHMIPPKSLGEVMNARKHCQGGKGNSQHFQDGNTLSLNTSIETTAQLTDICWKRPLNTDWENKKRYYLHIKINILRVFVSYTITSSSFASNKRVTLGPVINSWLK